MRDKSILLFFGLFFSLCSSLTGQEIVLKGGFLSDSVKIGENVNYWLTITYSPNLQAVLPDSNYNFEPFELYSKQYFPSKIVNTQIVDSAVYELQTYEIDPILYLKTRATLFAKGDSISIESNADSILLDLLVSQVTDTTSLIANTDYIDVNRQFNYPLYTYILAGLGVITILVLVIFGKKIRRFFILKKLKKDYAHFSEYITIQIRSLKESPQPKLAEDTVTEWKKYLEKLEKKPFTKLTSKEIVLEQQNEELAVPLKEIDRSVYGKAENSELYKAFQALEDFTQHRYAVTTENIKHG